MKRAILTLCFGVFLAGQSCETMISDIPEPAPQGIIGINAEPSGAPLPEVGAPVSIRIISKSSVDANVLVRYLVGSIEVRRTQLGVPAGVTMPVIGPDLAAVVEISGQFASGGGATPSVVLTLGKEFEAGDTKDYILLDPFGECPETGKPFAGQCGCDVPDTDSDGDGTADCIDNCPNSPGKVNPGICGCDTPETDTDGDSTPDCRDLCPQDPGKQAPGLCGCGVPDIDSNENGIPDCNEPPVNDCNNNGVEDAIDISTGTSQDCNNNGRPDECDIALGLAGDRSLANGTTPGGPVLIGGDDADDHGRVTNGVNQDGWIYIQDGFTLIGQAVRNGNRLAVCLGCNGGRAEGAFNSGFDLSALPGAGWTRATLTTEADIAAFFGGTGSVNVGTAGIIYMPTDTNNVDGGIRTTQVAVVNNHAATIDDFVSNGGGLFVHDQSFIPGGWAWLKALLPGISVIDVGDCDDGVLNLTPEGASAFPNLTDAIATRATPWHSHFSGEFGGLTTLITGPCGETHEPVILGGAQVVIQKSITLAPLAARNPVRTPHTVRATVITGDQKPVVEEEVSFLVTEGPNAGTSGFAWTDSSGAATFTYVGAGGEGLDVIEASFVDRGLVRKSNAVTKAWIGSGDCNDNDIPDDCEQDSDGDGIIDACDPCPEAPASQPCD